MLRWRFTTLWTLLFTFVCLGSSGFAQPNVAANNGVPQPPVLVVQSGNAQCNSVAFSPDGKQVLTGGFDGAVRLWDLATGAEIRRYRGRHGVVWSAIFSPDGSRILTSGSSPEASIWDVATGRELLQLKGHSGPIPCLAWSPDGKRVLTGSSDRSIRLWDAATGAELQRLSGHTEAVSRVAFSFDGSQALSGSNDKTVRLWDLTTFQQVLQLEHPDPITSVAFSPNGAQLLTNSNRTARVWDRVSGKEIRRFEHPSLIHSGKFSPDGSQILIGCSDKIAYLWDVNSGRELRRFTGHGDAVWSVAFSGGGKYVLTGSWDGVTRLFQTEDGQILRYFLGRSEAVNTAAFSPDGKSILLAINNRPARLWNLATGQEERQFEGWRRPGRSAAFSPDGKRVLIGGSDYAVSLFDTATGGELLSLNQQDVGTYKVAFSPDGTKALNTALLKAHLWDLNTGKEIRTFSHPIPAKDGMNIWDAAFSPDGKQLLTAGDDKIARLWDVETGEEIRHFEGHTSWIWCTGFSPDGKQILTGSADKTVRLWDVATGKETRLIEDELFSVMSLTVSPDGKQVAVGAINGAVRLWELNTGKSLWQARAHTASVSSVAFSPNGKFLLTGSADGTARLWDAVSGRELCTLVNFTDKTWAVTDPEGRYDASNGGDVEGLHWVFGDEPIDLKQFKDGYYEPGLLAKQMGFNRDALRPVPSFADLKLYPTVQVTLPKPGQTRLSVQLRSRGGGIGPVQVFLNGKEFLADARGANPDSNAREATLPIDLAGPLLLPGQENTIRVVPRNGRGDLAGRGVSLVWSAPGIATERRPELYAIVAGISRYADPDKVKTLGFAAKDASDFARALRLGAQRLFGTERVHLTLLSDPTSAKAGVSGIPTSLAATKATFRQVFAELARKAHPEDILVVYLSGHGISLSRNSSIYCYLTQDARSTDLADSPFLNEWAVTSEELAEWTKNVSALKQVLVLDTCAAGAAAANLSEQRQVSGDQIRAMERLKDRVGFHVLMGCAADAVSYEATRYGQGLLTYSLLQGMRGSALRDAEFVDVSRLFQYAADQVPLLAGSVGGIQKPLVAAPKGTSFDVGQLAPEDRAALPLAEARPLILRPILLNSELLTDNLNLTPLLTRKLREESYLAEFPKDRSSIGFVDADALLGATQPSGTYVVSGKRVLIRLVLSQDGKLLGNPLTIEGTTDALDGLVGRLVEAVHRLLAAR